MNGIIDNLINRRHTHVQRLGAPECLMRSEGRLWVYVDELQNIWTDIHGVINTFTKGYLNIYSSPKYILSNVMSPASMPPIWLGDDEMTYTKCTPLASTGIQNLTQALHLSVLRWIYYSARYGQSRGSIQGNAVNMRLTLRLKYTFFTFFSTITLANGQTHF